MSEAVAKPPQPQPAAAPSPRKSPPKMLSSRRRRGKSKSAKSGAFGSMNAESFLGARKRRCGPRLNTQERLFGAAPSPRKEKKVSDTFRSQIFTAATPPSPARTPKKAVPIIERNPITGEVKMPAKVEM